MGEPPVFLVAATEEEEEEELEDTTARLGEAVDVKLSSESSAFKRASL